MGDIASWQRANNKKSSPMEQAPAQHNAKIYGTPPGASMNPKIAKPTHAGNVCGHNVSMKKSPLMLADGGDVDEAAMKQAGLEASKGESVGLIERLRMGNIDQEGSEAYNRFGAGRGRAEAAKTAAAAAKARDDADFDEVERSFSTATSVTGKEEAKAPSNSGDFQRTDKDTGPGATRSMPARVAPRVESKKAASADYDETDRLKKRVPGPRSVVMKPAARSAEFDPDRIDNFGPAPAPAAATVRRHPRTGRPY